MQRMLDVLLRRTEVLALFPILVLLAYETGGSRLVVAAAMILPTLLVLQNIGPGRRGGPPAQSRGPTADRDAMLAMLERIASTPDIDGACLVVEIDDWSDLCTRWGADMSAAILERCGTRLRAAIRSTDLLADLGGGRFGIVINTPPVLRLNHRDAIANRVQATLSEPLIVANASLRLTACVGHALLQGDRPDPAGATLDAAEAALQAAQVSGPNSVRAHGPGLRLTPADRLGLAPDVHAALETGAILPWFQPQIDAVTGEVTGFEALARWHHPQHGLVAPANFLGAVAEAGAMAAFGASIRRRALAALVEWDRIGFPGLTVSVNASAEELRSPTFAEQIAWDLDAAEIAPGRLIVEVLETVAASSQDDAVMKTLAALREQGVLLDLDDFGIGQASLLSIRRFGVRRIKIDRSFVIGVDHDPEQRAMVGVIVSLAREMGLSTLAEGVETDREHDTLIELGCNVLQGFVVGKPMPFDDTCGWLRDREIKRAPMTMDAAVRSAH